VKYTFIAAQKAEFPVSVLCSVLGASRSGYYAWCARPQAAREQQDAILAEAITEVHDQSRGTYGSPRVHAELKQRGVQVGKKRIARLMRDRGLAARRKRRFRPSTTESQHPHPVAANLLARSFSRPAPNQAWVGDITYIRTDEGWLYLAVLLDLFSRRVVGWSMSEHIDTQLALGALRMAVSNRRSSGVLHHTDRGIQYASLEYRQALADHGLTASMSRKGNCWDNAVAESFFATLKAEVVHQRRFTSRAEARRAIFDYIEVFYNRRRRHSAIQYLSPMEFEAQAMPTFSKPA
jgi:transposase InsO family protein